jgi:hypothetical protein
VPFPVAVVVTVAGGVTASLPSNLPLKGTCSLAAGWTTADDDVTAAMVDNADVGLVGVVVWLHPTNRKGAPMSTTIAADEARIEDSFGASW